MPSCSAKNDIFAGHNLMTDLNMVSSNRTTRIRMIVFLFFGVFSQALCVSLDLSGTWYTGSNNGTPSLSNPDSNNFTWGTDGSATETTQTGFLWSYFSAQSLANDGDSITLSFTVTPLDATAAAHSFRFGLFNSGGSQVLNNLVGTNSDTGFLSTLGYFSQWNQGGTVPDAYLYARTAGKTNPLSSTSLVQLINQDTVSPTLAQGAAYDMTLTVTRNSAMEYGVTSSIDGAVISGTTTTINATSFDTVAFLNPPTGIDSFTFSNLQIHFSPVIQPVINFNDYTILSYGGSQDVEGTAVIENDGVALHLTGNVWKCIQLPLTITPDTVLEFDFQSSVEGEEHAIGMDADLIIQQDNSFKVYGTQTTGTILLDFDDYASYAPDTRHYIIPIGQYYTGSMQYLFFVNDHDVASPTGESVFSNIQIYDADVPPQPEEYTVDDFDYELNDPTLIDHWIDGSANATGSLISPYLAFYMNMFFDNTQPPYYSEVEYAFDTPIAADPNMDLTFWYLGDPNVDDIYVELSDNSATRTLRVTDLTVTQAVHWTEVRLPLADFTGLDIAHITGITLGIGPESPSSPGGTGTVGFDEVRIVSHQCDLSFAHLNLNEDCMIDIGDILVLGNSWLLEAQTVTASAPDDNQLLIHYALDETSGNAVPDSSGHSHHGTIEPTGYDPNENWQSGGIDGSGCIDFDGQFRIDVPQTAFEGIGNEITISFWHYAGADNNPQVLTPVTFTTHFPGTDDLLKWDPPAPQAVSAGWNHYAFVKYASQGRMQIYENGVLMASTENVYGSMDEMDLSSCTIGADTDGQSDEYLGTMDDFHVYSYALSQNEIAYLSGGGASVVKQPLVPLEISADPQPDGRIDLRDFALIASEWLSEL